MAGIKALEPKEEAKINTGAADPAYFKDRAAVTFTSDGYGTLDEVQVWSRRASNSYGCESEGIDIRYIFGGTQHKSRPSPESGLGCRGHRYSALGR